MDPARRHSASAMQWRGAHKNRPRHMCPFSPVCANGSEPTASRPQLYRHGPSVPLRAWPRRRRRPSEFRFFARGATPGPRTTGMATVSNIASCAGGPGPTESRTSFGAPLYGVRRPARPRSRHPTGSGSRCVSMIIPACQASPPANAPARPRVCTRWRWPLMCTTNSVRGPRLAGGGGHRTLHRRLGGRRRMPHGVWDACDPGLLRSCHPGVVSGCLSV